MDFLQTSIEMLASATRRVWPGVMGGVLLAYLLPGYGMAGFLVVSCIGAFLATWLAAWLGLAPVQRLTNNSRTDMAITAGGATVLVWVGYFLLNLVLVLAALALVGMLAAAWMAG
jgi:hypothetical protein